jgi:hypothetical protein
MPRGKSPARGSSPRKIVCAEPEACRADRQLSLFLMSCQLADKRSDSAPRFAGDDEITGFNLVRLEIKVR